MKLRTLKPALSTLAPIIRGKRDDRIASEAGRSWYKTRRWKELRIEILTRDRFTCRECGNMILDMSLAIAHHRIPHHGNANLFWDRNNLITVCKGCHDGSIKQQERETTIPGHWD